MQKQICRCSLCLCVCMCKCMQWSRCVGSLCPGVRDLLQWLMGFLCEAPQGAVHNHWARPQPRQACPSHEEKRKAGRREGGGENIPSLSFTLSFLPSAHPSCFSLSTFTTTPTHFSLLSLSVGPCPLFNSNCGTSTCTRTRAHRRHVKNNFRKHTGKRKKQKCSERKR